MFFDIGYELHKMEKMTEHNREMYLLELAEMGMIHRSQIKNIMCELHHRDIMKENDVSPFVKSARKMLSQAEEDFQHPERRKPHQCPECHGVGMRYVTVCIRLRQGNYHRADGSYHMEEEGNEREDKYEWKTCPDCHGTGKVK